ncbi:MAG: hypothetical protein CVT86_03640 [Alphaproteobacteria bacterium HGW-Alphaproteobacteria-8]|jgi:exonuclease I|nr:MAG: hypothetical protein CVT86_03640 [Alphaproteobacteria bacterium HGW-Alphaproteobacteria-8]
MGFVFYDLETTGISPTFDQPLQFAAIRTDDSFAEIERPPETNWQKRRRQARLLVTSQSMGGRR